MNTTVGIAWLISGALILFRLVGEQYRGKVILTKPVLISLGVSSLITYLATL